MEFIVFMNYFGKFMSLSQQVQKKLLKYDKLIYDKTTENGNNGTSS